MTRAVETRFGEGSTSVQVTPERLAGLDLLRLFAAIAVVVFHFGYAGAARGTMSASFPEIADVAKYGFLGVDLFFLISGFVIAASAENRSATQFALSRFLRLYPAYVVCMCMTAFAVLWIGGTGASISPGQWLANLTMFAPAFGQSFVDGVYWTVVLEIVFYGWVGVLIATGLYRRRLLSVLAAWLAIALVNEIFFQWRPLRIAMITEYAGLFASGILIHRIRQGDRCRWVFALLAIAFGHGLVHALESQQVFARIYGSDIGLSVLWMLHGSIYAVFAAALVISSRLRATPFVMALGGLTYPLYLLHQQAGYLVIDALAPATGRCIALALTTAGSLAAAWAVHALAEPRGRMWLRRILAGLGADSDFQLVRASRAT